MKAYVHDAVLDMHAGRDELLAALHSVPRDDWGRYVPYGSRTLHELLAHVAGADQAWALAAQGLLKGESEDRPALNPDAAREVRQRGIESRRDRTPDDLLDEMQRRRSLLLGLYELLEPKHLALALRSYGDAHNSVRERIWVGYHDRLHAADVGRALRIRWHPQRLPLLPEVLPVAEALAPDPALYIIFSVDPAYWERPSPLPGWSCRQLLAHIATGDWVLQMHIRHVIETGAAADWPDINAETRSDWTSAVSRPPAR